MSALWIRRDRTPRVLRKLAKGESDARISRRILAIANALDGMSREVAAQSAGMDCQTLRDWVIRYNEHGLDGLADRPRDGGPPKLNAEEKAALYRIVLDGPAPEASGLSAFTREDLVRICASPRRPAASNRSPPTRGSRRSRLRVDGIISQQTAVYWPHDTSGSFVDPSGVCVRTMHWRKVYNGGQCS